MKSFIFAEISSFFYPKIVPRFFPTCFSSYQSVICPQYTIYEQRKSDLKTISCGTILCESRMQHLTRAGLVMHSKDGFRHICVCVSLCMCATSACLCVSSLMMTFLHTILLTWGLKQNQDQTDLWLPLVLLQLFPCVSSLCLIHWTGGRGGLMLASFFKYNWYSAVLIVTFMSMKKAWTALSHVLHILVNANVISSIGESPSY